MLEVRLFWPVEDLAGLAAMPDREVVILNLSKGAFSVADEPISALATFPASPTSATGTSADEIEFLDVNDTSMAATGTNKRVNMADFFSTFVTAGTNITVTKQTTGGGVSIASGGGTPGGTSGQIQYNNTTFGGFTMSGDATLVTSTGVITVGAGTITYAKMQNTS